MVSLYTSRIVLEALGFVDFGVYSVVGGIVTVFTALTTALSGSSARFITLELGKEDHSQLNKVFSTAAILHFLLAGMIVLLSEVVGVWFLNTQLDIPADRMYAANWLLQFSVLAAAINFTQVPYNAAMIAHEQMNIFAFVGLYSSFANLGIAFLIIHEPFDRLIWYGLLVLCVNISTMLISRLYCIRKFDECSITYQKDKKAYRDMLSYTGYSLWINIAWMAQNQGVTFIMNMFFGPVLNAAQSISSRIYALMEQLYGGFGTALKPSVYKLYAQGEWGEMNKLVERGAQLSFLLVLLAVIPLAINAEFVFTLWLGNFPEYTIPITICVMIMELFAVIGNTRLMLFQASNHIKQYSIVNGSIILLGLPSAYILFKCGFSPVSAYVCLIITAIMSDAASLFLINKYIEGYSVRRFLIMVHFRCLGLAVMTYLCVYVEKLFIPNNWVALFTTTLTSILMIGSFVWFVVLSSVQRRAVLGKIKNPF